MIAAALAPFPQRAGKRLQFDVIVLPFAARDIELVYLHMASRSRTAANNWIVSFFRSLSDLKWQPAGSGIADETIHFDEDIHETLFEFEHGYTIRALTLIKETRCIVLRIAPSWLEEQ